MKLITCCKLDLMYGLVDQILYSNLILNILHNHDWSMIFFVLPHKDHGNLFVWSFEFFVGIILLASLVFCSFGVFQNLERNGLKQCFFVVHIFLNCYWIYLLNRAIANTF